MICQRVIYILVFLGIFAPELKATHNRAGEITYEQIDALTIRATIATYTRTSSFAADRDSLDINWGDGTFQTVKRSNGAGEALPNDVQVNYYIAEHRYPTRGTYTMSVEDPNRIAGILNIDYPNSVNIRFYIETTFTLLDTRFQGRNNSAILLQPPIDFACVGQIFTHNPNAYDPDGDSLGYELITPFQSKGVEVPNYELPDQIRPSSDNIARLDPLTGDFIWDAPPLQGEFNLTYRINEYREGVLINSIIRDMQILVRGCADNNRAPEIDIPVQLCVIAGDKISLDILGTDPDTSEILTITALGGPFEQEISPATFEVIPPDANSMAQARFEWTTSCEHVSIENYKVVFKVTDTETRPNTGLATLKTLLIKVVAPPPVNVQATYDNGRTKLTWDHPYPCEDALVFQGFSVWRRPNSANVVIDSCQGGLEGQGYEKIIFITDEIIDGKYTAFDLDIEGADTWCYRIVGEYARLTDSDNPFNKVQSIPSEETCVLANREKALMTQASVLTTATSGEVSVKWWLPLDADIDRARFPAPYRASLRAAPNYNNANSSRVPQASFVADNFVDIDTSFIATAVNTAANPNSYQIELQYQSDRPLTNSNSASTIFLSTRANDERAILSWDFQVPWNNYSFIVYEILENGTLLPVDTTTENTSTIFNLINNQEYCFLIESYGKYNIIEIADPLINRSQVACISPVDSLAPCTPSLTVSTVCDLDELNASLTNTIRWSNDPSCEQNSDIAGYNIYFKNEVTEPFEFLEQLDASANAFDHLRSDNIAGCYAISAIDSSGNESDLSLEFCVDNCPSFELPNAFTPNNDGANDIYRPRIARFIESVNFEVFNRWGQLVFSTNESLINWDGRHTDGSPLAAGTYFYTCTIFEKRVDGIIQNPDVLTGHIQLIK